LSTDAFEKWFWMAVRRNSAASLRCEGLPHLDLEPQRLVGRDLARPAHDVVDQVVVEVALEEGRRIERVEELRVVLHPHEDHALLRIAGRLDGERRRGRRRRRARGLVVRRHRHARTLAAAGRDHRPRAERPANGQALGAVPTVSLDRARRSAVGRVR
jgi:hypothetical protein